MTSTPHDAIFKSTFGNPENAAAELRHVLPAQIVAAIQWSSLTLESGSFVDDELADQHSDLLFTASATTSGARVLVYLLFEHQSTNDPLMALRLLGYMVRIWTRHAQAHPAEPLPLIIPAVLAQVPGGWSAPTRFSELFAVGVSEFGRDVLPEFSFVVDDLHRTTDDDLHRRALADQAKLTLWLMRDARDGAALVRRVASWSSVLEALALAPGGERALLRLLRYIALTSDELHFSQFRDMLVHTAPATEALTMTAAEQLIAEGETRGRSEGRSEGRAKSVLLIMGARGIRVTEAIRIRIEACTDIEMLDHWLVRAATIPTTEDIFED